MTPRRRRGLVLLALAVASGGLAASQVSERERNVDAKIGPLVSVVVAARNIAPDKPLRRADMTVERVPARFVPPDALGAPASLTGARPAVPVAAGAYITGGVLHGGQSAGDRALKPGERAVELAVAGGGALAAAGPGSRVDVLVSTQTHEGGGRTVIALEDLALLDLRPAAGGELALEEPAEAPAASTGPATAFASVRVTARQAVYLTAADSFAHEIRLLVRPPGDRGRSGAVAVTEGEL